MTLNISPEQRVSSKGAETRAVATGEPGASERVLVNDVIDELTSWSPREFITAFQRWHHSDVSLIHLNVLALLEARGPIAMGQLAEALDISVASATGVVDRMEKRGLVERRHDADDRRIVLVHPAAGAKTVFGEIDARRRRGLGRLLEHLTDDELSGLLRGHRALRAARAALATAVATEGAAAGERPTTGEEPAA